MIFKVTSDNYTPFFVKNNNAKILIIVDLENIYEILQNVIIYYSKRLNLCI